MTESFGISGGGKSAEDEFIRITGAERTSRAALGDAMLEGHPVEVKRATSTTLNQVRAVKYIPLVVYYVPAGVAETSWYVVPAHIVVSLVSRRIRGQHTENPFESSTLSVSTISDYKVTDVSQLRDRTVAAIAASDQYPELRSLMRQVLENSRALAVDSVSHVRGLLDELGIS